MICEKYFKSSLPSLKTYLERLFELDTAYLRLKIGSIFVTFGHKLCYRNLACRFAASSTFRAPALDNRRGHLFVTQNGKKNLALHRRWGLLRSSSVFQARLRVWTPINFSLFFAKCLAKLEAPGLLPPFTTTLILPYGLFQTINII